MTTTPESEPSEREARLAGLRDLAADMREATRHRTANGYPVPLRTAVVMAHAALAWFAARPAPVVSEEAVERAVRAVSTEDGFEYDPDTVTFVAAVLAAIGITVAAEGRA